MGDVLFTFDLLTEQLKEVLQIVVKVFFEPINHSVVVVFLDSLLDILALKENLLLTSCDGVDQERVVFVVLILQVILVQNMLILFYEIVNKLAIITIVLFT